MNEFDALVIGGGPGGATAARLLAEAGWSVAVVEKAAFPRRKVCGEYLAPTNYPLFRHLGVLDAFMRSAGPEVRRIELVLKATTITAMMSQKAVSDCSPPRDASISITTAATLRAVSILLPHCAIRPRALISTIAARRR